jgi:H+/gluconate symporter-like permease
LRQHAQLVVAALSAQLSRCPILLIVAAGGGFKQLLVDAGVANLVSDAAKGAKLSPLILGWLIAVGIRLATAPRLSQSP